MESGIIARKRCHLKKSLSTGLPYAGLIIAMALWASSFIVLKLAFRSYDPMLVILGRMLVASVCVLFFFSRLKAVAYRKGDWKPLLFMGFCEPCLYFLFEAKAIENTTASQAGMICALLPLIVAVGARVFLKETITARTLTGFVIAISGAVWLSAAADPEFEAPNPALGNFLEFIAMLCATGYIITLKRLTVRYSPFALTGFQALTGAVFYLPVLVLPTTTLPTHMDVGGMLAIVYLGTFITLGAYGLYNFGLSRVPATQASAFVNLIPVLTIVMAWLILGERFKPVQYLAAVLIFIGIFLSQDKPASE